MNWILLALLIYTLCGALLIARTMRGMQVSASAGEWVTLIFLWPLMLRFFVHLAAIQSRIAEMEKWADRTDRKR